MLGLEGLVRHLGGGPVRVPRRDWTRHLGVAACFKSKRKGGQFVNLNQLQIAKLGKIEGCNRCTSRLLQQNEGQNYPKKFCAVPRLSLSYHFPGS
jgi:hypothetical protein